MEKTSNIQVVKTQVPSRRHICSRHGLYRFEQPKQPKGWVKRKRETSSLARSEHSCVRKALLEMVNFALNYNGGMCSR
jgi:hypothetical protein